MHHRKHLPLRIPSCIHEPAHPHHPPPLDKPLRINIEGPFSAVDKLVPDVRWNLKLPLIFPQEAGPKLAKIAYREVYGRDPEQDDDLVVVDEGLGWVGERPFVRFDYYRVTFDHRVPAAAQHNPETLQININEVDYDGGAYSNQTLLFPVNAADYTGKAVLAIPRCCQRRRGTTDRERINEDVIVRRTGVRPSVVAQLMQPGPVRKRPIPVPDAVPLRRYPEFVEE